MKQTTIARCVAWGALLCVLGGGAPQNPIPPIPAEVAVEGPPIFPLADIRRGLKGHGYTVFASARGPERFDFEVLGVLRDYLGPGEDLIIAQLKGEQIERTGVISGMSGSPAYIDGKLVGAVGYRFGSFTKDPIAGITPIERMLTAAEPLPDGVVADGAAADRRSPAGKVSRRAQSAWGEGQPIAVPISVSGAHPEVLDAFRPHLEARGYGPVVSAGGGARPGDKPRRFYAGGPIAGTLVDGDMAMSGIGTVTWVKGDRFLAFGHPFNGTGRSMMPVANAEILTTVAALGGSWKMGQATVPVGRLTDDRLHAIAGTLGETPRTVDLTVDLDLAGPRAAADAKKQLRFRVMRDGPESALFTAIVLANALTSRVGLERGGTVELTGVARFSNGMELPLHDRAALDGSAAVFINVAIGLLGDLGRVVDNPFEDVELDAVALRVSYVEEVSLLSVVGIDVPRPLVPGETGEVRVRLASYQGRVLERRVTVDVPPGLDEGHYRLVAADPGKAGRLEQEAGAAPEPTDLAGVVEALKKAPRPGTLSLYLVSDANGLRMDGQGLMDLPPSLQGLLEEGGGWSGQVLETRASLLARIRMQGVVSGQARAKVWVGGEKRGER